MNNISNTPNTPEKNKQVYYYISCDEKEYERISAICRELRRRNVSVAHDNGKVSGEQWASYVSAMINNSHTYILFVTKDLLAHENRFVRNEFFFAQKSGKKMYAVLLDSITPDDVSDSLKKWFNQINQCICIHPAPQASPANVVKSMNEVISFACNEAAPNTSNQTASPIPQNAEVKQDAENRQSPASNQQTPPDHKTQDNQNDPAPKKRPKFTVAAAIGGAVVLLVGAVVLFVSFFLGGDDPSFYNYDITEDGVVILSLANEETTSLHIPSKIEGKPVVMIGESAFSGCINLKKVKIPKSVKKIDRSAFLYCENLTQIRIPNSVTSIGESAFSNCSSLTDIQLSSSLKEIADDTFYGCTNLRSVNIPHSVKSIGESAFMECASLKSVTIPDSVKSIGGSAFEHCSALSEVKLSDSVNEISYSCFEGCQSLKEAIIPTSVREIGDYAFSGCPALKKAVIPDSVQNIVDSAFLDCPGLTVYGKTGSCAEEYAVAHSIPFKAQQP